MTSITLNTGAGGASLLTDQVGGVDAQVIKVSYSTAGQAPVQVDIANGLPVQPATGAIFAISAASLPLPAGAATAAGLTTINTTLGTPLQAGGNVAVTNFPGSQAVTGTFWQATQPVSGTFWQATQPVSGTVTTTPPANASTNVAQFGSTNVSTGTGTGGAGIPRVTVSSDSFPATQAVSAVSLPLPTGAATAALQSAIITALGSPVQATTTPTIVQAADAQYDDDGIPYVNPNVPGADIATGDRQAQGNAILQSILTVPTPAGANKIGAVDAYVTTPGMSALGFRAFITPGGNQQVSVEPFTLLSDDFNGTVIDTTRWMASGSVPPKIGSGAALFSLSATNLASSVLTSNPTFTSTFGQLLTGAVVTLDSAKQANPNNHRFWGIGTPPAAYSSATPLTDAAGFEIDTTGELNLVVYASGVRTVINSTNTALITAQGSLPTGAQTSTLGSVLTWPTNQHIFVMRYRPDAIFWYIDQFDTPVGFSLFVAPTQTLLPVRFASVNAAAGALSTTFQTGATAVGDTASQNSILSDGTYPWQKATIKPTTPVASDNALVVALSPNSVPSIGVPLESGGNLQRIADLLERILLQERVACALLGQLSQPWTDDPDQIANDLPLSVN